MKDAEASLVFSDVVRRIRDPHAKKYIEPDDLLIAIVENLGGVQEFAKMVADTVRLSTGVAKSRTMDNLLRLIQSVSIRRGKPLDTSSLSDGDLFQAFVEMTSHAERSKAEGEGSGTGVGGVETVDSGVFEQASEAGDD